MVPALFGNHQQPKANAGRRSGNTRCLAVKSSAFMRAGRKHNTRNLTPAAFVRYVCCGPVFKTSIVDIVSSDSSSTTGVTNVLAGSRLDDRSSAAPFDFRCPFPARLERKMLCTLYNTISTALMVQTSYILLETTQTCSFVDSM